VTAVRNMSRNTSEIESQLVRDGAVPVTPALVGLLQSGTLDVKYYELLLQHCMTSA
jgi:hypothetical protein